MADATAARPDRTKALLETLTYAVAALIPLAVIVMLIRPWETGFAVPFAAGGDATIVGTMIKGVLGNGSWLTNPSLAAPVGANYYDLPGADTVSYLVVRLLGFFSGDWATVLNVFYLLSYPAVALTSVFALRKLGSSRLVAACGAVLFALLPYHWLRGEGHIFLSAYAMVPLLVLVAFWMDGDRVPLLARPEIGGPLRWDWRSRHSVAALVICIIGSGTGVYYAFFGAAFIVFAAVRAAIRRSEKRIAMAGLALAIVMGLTAVVQVLPNLVPASQMGPNTAGLVRNPGQAEIAGLKITQMFLPIDGHRIGAFARLKATYRAGLAQIGPSMNNEGNIASLGMLIAIGFLISLLAFAFWPERGSPPAGGARVDHLRTAGFLNLGALLLATVGGFGAMIAVVLPQIRSYNRISVFVGFIAVVALAAVAERALARWTAGPRRVALVAVFVALTVLAVLDQTPATLVAAPAQVAQYRSDVAFGATVQTALPAGSAILQIPYMPFPEPGGAIFGMQDYDPLRGYLHADGLRWSYGAMKGRAEDAWQKATAALAPTEMIAAAKARGFTALWVQLNGYADRGTAIRATLTDLLGGPVAVSDDGVFAVWKL